MTKVRLFGGCLGFGFLLFALFSQAQVTTVQGKVTDSNSGDPIPFANLVFTGTTIGTTTDFDGNYLLKTSTKVDSLRVTYIGYKSKTKPIVNAKSQVVNFQLDEDIINLQEVVVLAGENPAWEVMRRVIKNKPENDKRKLIAYEYDTYTKVEIDVDNISDELREKKIMKKITMVLDSVDRIAGEDGKPILPLFISESISKIYYRDNPSLKKEFVEKTKINGLGVEDGTLIAQVIGSSFQEYNFYQNWLNIVSKEFVSPIADGWRLYYEYDLTDSLFIGNHYCYRLDFFPKSEQDLAFNGTLWVTKNGYAIKQLDVTVTRTANLNFIEKIKIQQELEPTTLGPWLPVKNRVLVDVGELTKTSAGMLAKFYTSNKNFVVNAPHSAKFYERSIEMAEDVRMYEDEKYWDTLRHEPLSLTEKNVIKMIDTLQNIPIVKTYVDLIKIAVNGYMKAGPLDIGPYIFTMAINDIEGLRLQSGFKTNIKFSNKWILGGQLGYGFVDEKFKYSAYVRNIISRKNWTTLTVRYRNDLARIGIEDEHLRIIPYFTWHSDGETLEEDIILMRRM
ncbi:MAG: carboxypeptidase-like regulatory domain-containing protein [Flammeovirgaceae bacterium]|nr:carboxypeptidase-like regulatory domain-containing protein [Flammeovirgaceae bacterium]